MQHIITLQSNVCKYASNEDCTAVALQHCKHW